MPSKHIHITTLELIFTLDHFDAAFCELKRLNHLRYLDLQNNRLEGIIPSCLGMIGNLQDLILSNNHLYGNLPPSIFSEQSKIKVFHVSANQLDGVLLFSTFANASSLQYLDLSSNLFHGNLPPSLFSKQSKIKTFDVSDNQLEGVLSFSTFANASSLQGLYLSGNRFHGNLPPSIFSKQSKIKVFHVLANQLDGVLSFSTFANASSLEELDLSSNYNLEIETESPSWVPTFQLYSLNLGNCSLNKKNGHVLPSFITTQVALKWLDLSHNLIEGSIPCQLLFNTSIKVYSWEVTKLMALFFLVALLIELHHLCSSTCLIIMSKVLFLKILDIFFQSYIKLTCP
jgi:Leucine-rich repeat (LRR) protein